MTTGARDTLWLLFILMVVAVVWSMRGGNFNLIPQSGPRLSPTKSLKTVSESIFIFDRSEQNNEQIKIQNEKRTVASNAIQITIVVEGAQNTDPQQEYIIIRNDGVENINLSNAEIKNKNNVAAKVENDENGKPIILKPGDKAHILTGKSTKGTNFKINKCSGYFNQFHQFIPSIFSQCPNINDLPGVNNFDNTCIEYLAKLELCQMPVSLPTDLGSSCQNFIQQHANYQGCVNDHKNDSDFDKGDWRIFLNRTTEMWEKRNETVKLIDQTGKIIAEANY